MILFCILMLFDGIIFGIPELPPFFNKESQWSQETLQSLTLREKIGQLFVVAAASNFNQPTELLSSAMQSCPYIMNYDYIEKLIEEHHIGGIIFLFKSDPTTQMKMAHLFQKKSKIPLLMVQDCEWGLSMRLDIYPKKVVRYPRNMTLGALNNEQLIYELGFEIGKQCAAMGIHMNLAPVIDINSNPENPVIHDRSIGDNPERVARLGSLYMQGLQDAGIIACAKHFPGHGDTAVDSHIDLPKLNHSITRLENIELVPFKTAINNGIGAIMLAHLSIPAFDSIPNIPSSMSYEIVTKKLKNNLGFCGLVITDGLGMNAITKNYERGNIVLKALLAGNDILLCPLDVPKAIAYIEEAIMAGKITEAELDRRVLKILKAKEWAFEKQKRCEQFSEKIF